MTADEYAKRGLLRRLGEVWCFLRTGHANIAVIDGSRKSWFLRCYLCGAESSGWSIDSAHYTLPLSTADIKKVEADLIEAELDIHPGG